MPAKVLVYEPVSWSPHLPKIHYTHVSRSSLKYSRLLKYPLAVVRVGAHVSLMAYTRAGYTAACSIENNGEPSCQTPLLCETRPLSTPRNTTKKLISRQRCGRATPMPTRGQHIPTGLCDH